MFLNVIECVVKDVGTLMISFKSGCRVSAFSVLITTSQEIIQINNKPDLSAKVSVFEDDLAWTLKTVLRDSLFNSALNNSSLY